MFYYLNAFYVYWLTFISALAYFDNAIQFILIDCNVQLSTIYIQYLIKYPDPGWMNAESSVLCPTQQVYIYWKLNRHARRVAVYIYIYSL